MVVPLLLTGCGNHDDVFRQESFVFGTRVEISIAGASTDKAEAATREVLARFDTMHKKLHAWQPSDLERLNTAFTESKKQVVDAELANMLQDARAYSELSGGLFNPAIGNLIRLWGFHADLPQSSVPDANTVAAAVQAMPSMRDIHIENGMAWSDNPAVRVDLGGYTKGYALDEAAVILKRHGIRNALVNIGGNVMALGMHDDRAWKVGLQHPRKAGVIATLELRDGEAIGTSGDYQRYFESGGRRYCHLIDPRNGQPAQSMQSVSVLVSGARAGVMSDVLTKPLFIAGKDELPSMRKTLGVTSLLAVTPDGSILATEEMARRLQWGDAKPSVQLVR